MVVYFYSILKVYTNASFAIFKNVFNKQCRNFCGNLMYFLSANIAKIRTVKKKQCIVNTTQCMAWKSNEKITCC